MAGIAAYLGAAAVGAFMSNGQDGGRSGPIEVKLIAGPIHYDFLLPVRPETLSAFDFAKDAFDQNLADADWLMVGWGARDFYTSTGSYSDLRPGPIWKAITGDSSVLRIMPVGGFDTSQLPSLHLTEAEFGNLLGAILASIPEPTPLPQSSTQFDAFFESAERFHIFHTCNVWIADVMLRAGLRFGRWTPTPYSVTWSLQRFQTPD